MKKFTNSDGSAFVTSFNHVKKNLCRYRYQICCVDGCVLAGIEYQQNWINEMVATTNSKNII